MKRIDPPQLHEIPQLVQVWINCFGEPDFWALFLSTAYQEDHCRCLFVDEELVAALYWFDCEVQDQKIAYLFAIATDPAHQHKGYCTELMADTHAHVKKLGYHSAMLVPADEDLRVMYRNGGYHTCTMVEEVELDADDSISVTVNFLTEIDVHQYMTSRQTMLSANSVIQEADNVPLLSEMAKFWQGDNWILAGIIEDNKLLALEYLGDQKNLPAILSALNCRSGHIRMPGNTKPFAMILPLAEGAIEPDYFGFAYD